MDHHAPSNSPPATLVYAPVSYTDDDAPFSPPPPIGRSSLYSSHSRSGSQITIQIPEPYNKNEHERSSSGTTYPPGNIHDLPSARPRPEHSRSSSRLSWARFTGNDRKHVGWLASIRAWVFSSWLNVFLLFTPISWTLRNEPSVPYVVKFVLLFLSVIPLISMFEFGGEQLALYCGKEIGDLIIITMNNVVEVTLAIFLLIHCEIRILQSTIIGVILLHLLLIPGTAFLTGGALTTEQTLNLHFTQLNHALLTVGVLAMLIPTAMFAALSRGSSLTGNDTSVADDVISSTSEHTAMAATSSLAGHATSTAETAIKTAVEHVRRTLTESAPASASNLISDTARSRFLQMSRGIAIILILIYIASRIFLHNPPKGVYHDLEETDLHSQTPVAIRRHNELLQSKTPKTNVWVCVVLLLIVTAITTISIQWLVESIEELREHNHVPEEWFGLILLPIVSFAADATVAFVYFARTTARRVFGTRSPPPPNLLAQATAIDLAIQFSLFWVPVLILLSWILGRPLTLLFDLYEITMLVGACFLVNYVTSDGKTNWVEGLCMCGFYLMIATATWWYQGQPEIIPLDSCTTVFAALSGGSSEGH